MLRPSQSSEVLCDIDDHRVRSKIGNLGRLPVLFKLLASLALAHGRLEHAVRLGAAVERYNEEIGGELSDVFGHLGDPVEEARPLLGPREHARASDEARSMGLEELVAYALEPVPSAQHTSAIGILVFTGSWPLIVTA
jgi:hypothetical protein